ncbi:hypothetical protein GCM10010377_81530 [Streptomyces viridiviolaceus]|uniref:Uncharacterized protein n=1 Tax=Streptomyces viridiviolaceus TaxID=68282 RepID=A0ABW2EFL7_9ACTN|nr:hypothetical protein [Streptomyces viridiviolaceus]GHB79193.1 hypothetical protein GCM10010377_81530 [Streptomyces viridiviolaceus]
MSSTHHILYDSTGRLAAELPSDRAVHEQVVRAALAWSSPLDVPAAGASPDPGPVQRLH